MYFVSAASKTPLPLRATPTVPPLISIAPPWRNSAIAVRFGSKLRTDSVCLDFLASALDEKCILCLQRPKHHCHSVPPPRYHPLYQSHRRGGIPPSRCDSDQS